MCSSDLFPSHDKRELGNLLIEFSQPTNEAVVMGAMKPRFSKEAVPGNAEEVREAKQWITQLVSQETGFGRVMYYHFREDGDGEVSAEVCSRKNMAVIWVYAIRRVTFLWWRVNCMC